MMITHGWYKEEEKKVEMYNGEVEELLTERRITMYPCHIGWTVVVPCADKDPFFQRFLD